MPAEVNNSAHNLTIESYISAEVKGKLGAMDSKCVIIKNLLMLSVRISRYGCTREVWRARKMRKSCLSHDLEQP